MRLAVLCTKDGTAIIHQSVNVKPRSNANAAGELERMREGRREGGMEGVREGGKTCMKWKRREETH